MIEFHVLGTLSLAQRDGQDLRPLVVRPKQLALLAYLVLHQPRGWQQRNSLLALFWPDSDDRRARLSLRNALHGLRSLLGPDAVLARGDDELMANADCIDCDAIAFENALDATRLDDALSLYRGPLLDGFVTAGVAEFQLWCDERRDGLRRRAVAAAIALADAAEVAENTDELVRWGRRAIELSPYDEPLVRRLLQVFERRGDRAEALSVYEQWVSRIRSDLDSDPSPETLAVAARLRTEITVAEPQAASVAPPKRVPQTASAEPAAPFTAVDPVVRPQPTYRRAPVPRFRHVAAGVAIGLAAIGLWLTGALGLRKAVVTTPGGTAVLPFAYSGDSSYARLAADAASLISAGLGETGPLRTVDAHEVERFVAKQPASLSSVALGERVGRDFGASHFVVGTIAVEHSVLQMQASLYAVGREAAPIGHATASGPADSVIEVAERLAFDLLAARVGGVPIVSLGTASSDAIRAYADGERQLFAARYAGAAEAYARATAADSEFVRAYFRLSYAASLGGHDAVAHAAGTRAAALESRLPPNDRILLDAWLASLYANIPLSISLYEKALSQDERNPEAWLQLAELRYHWGPSLGIPASQAALAFRHVTAVVPDNGASLIHLARIEARDAPGGGGFDSLTTAARSLNLAATEDLELRMLASILSGRGRDRDSVLAEAASRGAVTERLMLMTAVQFADTVVSAGLARSLTRSSLRADMRATGFVYLAQIAVSHGRVRAALQAARGLGAILPDRAVELHAWILATPFVKSDPREVLAVRDSLAHTGVVEPAVGSTVDDIAKPTIYAPRRRYLEAVLSILGRDTARAVALGRELSHWTIGSRDDSANADDYAQRIRAEVAMHASPAGAIAAFPAPRIPPEKMYPDLMSFLMGRDRYLRAEALLAAGRTTEALSWFETFPDPAGSDVWFLGAALLRRARLYASVGRREDASRARERLAAFWQGSDAEFGAILRDPPVF